MNADKCIGFCIEEDGGFVGMYELVVNDKVQRENINSINYFRMISWYSRLFPIWKS